MPLSESSYKCLMTAMIASALIEKGVAYDPPDKLVAQAANIMAIIIKTYK